MPTPPRKEIQPGSRVMIIDKLNQCSGHLTKGIVVHILTKNPSHLHAIKLRLIDSKVR